MQQSNEHSGLLEITRNVILAISTVAVLGILIAGYWMFTGGAAGPNRGPTRFETRLPDTELDLPADEQVGEVHSPVGKVQIPGGHAAGMTVYDEKTGEPIFRFALDEYRPVPGSINEIFCTKPELTQRLPGGMVATVSASEARIVAERSGPNIRPRSGRMTGNCVITVDRAAGSATPLRDRPRDRVVIEMDHFDFDLNLGVMKTDAAVLAVSREFEIGGVGLELIWNQALNRIDKLEMAQGQRLVLHLARGLAGSLEADSAADAATTQPGAAMGASATDSTVEGGAKPGALASGAATTAPARKRPATAYACTLAGPIAAEHYRDRATSKWVTESTRVGRLDAASLQLLFDMGGDAGRLLSRGERPDEQVEPREHLIVHWDGPLALLPALSPPTGDKPRRRIDALGPVTLTVPDGTIQAGELTLHQEVDRIWLRPAADGLVRIDLGGIHATASAVYHDGDSGKLKLIGPVQVRSAEGDPRGQLSIRCAHWAEIALDVARPAEADLGQGGSPRTVTFVGEVLADMGAEQLTANELTAYFETAADQRPLSGESVASGTDGVSSQAGRLRRVEAQGAVRLWSGRRWLTCWRLEAALAQSEDGVLYPREIKADGFVRLVDRERRIRARGRELLATMRDRRQLERATVIGGARDPADLLAEDYLVRGHAIDFDAPGQGMEVKGWSELTFRSTRSLRGVPQSGERVTRIVSQERLHVDLRDENNTVQFVGEVQARNGDEELLADSLTLYLRNLSADEEARQTPDDSISAARIGLALLGSSGAATWRAVRSGMTFTQESRMQVAEMRRMARGGEPARSATLVEKTARKEPVRLLARNAVLQSNVYARDARTTDALVSGALGQHGPDEPPLVHQSLAAPEINVELPQRLMRTVGGTTLYLIDRRMGGAGTGQAEAGAPSALVSGGPSQTVMRCERGLTYSLGQEGPNRADRVLMEGGVRFRRVTGNEMVNPETMLPAGGTGSAAGMKLEDRNTYLESERFEIELIGDPGNEPARRMPLVLSWIGASGDAYLRDQRGDQVRSIEADRLEFDRRNGLVFILGEGRPARIFDENRGATRPKLDIPAVGREIVLDLNTNTLRTGNQSIQGTIRR